MTIVRHIARREDFLIVVVFVAFCTITGVAHPAFFSIGTLFDLLRSAIVPGLFAIGVLLVLISGGIDVSFTAIAVLAMYASIKIAPAIGADGSAAAIFAIAMLLGLALGLINAFFIATLRLPTLIVTLGTLSLYRGALLTFVGVAIIPTLPVGLRAFSRATLLKIDASDGSISSLPSAILILVAVVVLAVFVLTRTTLGRSLYALGSSAVAAQRVGINVAALQYLVYGLVGLLSGAAGIVHASLERVANPFDLVGTELNVIAAVVLGGARLSGGTGTVFGTMLGVALISVMNNTLILWGVPATWQNVAVGFLILLGTGIPAWRAKRRILA